MQRLLLTALLALALAACGQEPAATPAPPAAEAAAPAPAPASEADAEPADPDAASTDAASTDAASTDAADADADAAGSADDAAAPADAGEADEAAASDAASGPAATTAAADVPLPGGPPPREGVDFEILPLPQPTYGSGDGIEVAEVFSYTCIHCANLQPYLNAWHERLPADVRFVYVPAAFGGVVDNFARAYFASEAMGLLEKTHDALFSAVLVERRIRTGSEEELADWYAAQGADRDVFLSTMRSFAVTGKLNRARQFALNTGVSSTPTIIVAGKYRAVATREGGMEGLLNTVDWLVARERGTAPDF
ncbi:MAG TPA: thiol:disulfide interchange protein DsbA/DsbL [Arenimonas sp.]|jgi:thiol:disulfide interchange protein DsbA|nr:thiol:disulfide interchange protein DsbA/DsbL [Arenimonas sp.]